MAWPPLNHGDLRLKLDSMINPGQRLVTANYPLVATDIDMMLFVTSATGVTITLPSDSTATYPVLASTPWFQFGLGQITFVAGAGASLVSWQSVYRSASQYADGIVMKISANTWLVSGALTA